MSSPKRDVTSTPAGPSNVDDPRGFDHRFADVNGIRLHYVEEGKGPLVILVHGFPYIWFWWRRQIRALAAAGYRVVAARAVTRNHDGCRSAQTAIMNWRLARQ